MDNKILTAMSAALLFGSGLALAAGGGHVTILSPADNATVSANDKTVLKYEADPGPEGDHLHLNVDGKRVDVIHELKGSTDVSLYPGKHQICLAVNTKGHTPTGTEACINVTAK